MGEIFNKIEEEGHLLEEISVVEEVVVLILDMDSLDIMHLNAHKIKKMKENRE
ncbi:hypothetical protein [Dendronalium sp. ChiSLP03b]|uniref:hypothetical protein n=1 Tax=Dendronalium sp. ChiSLP03b TaxID=3075381 RepID=UPI00391AE57A